MRLLPAIVANIVLIAAAWGYGSLLGRLCPENFSQIDRAVVRILGGLGIVGTGLFCIGQVWLSRPVILAALAIGIILGVVFSAKDLGNLREALANISLPVLPVAIVCGVLVVAGVSGLAMPTGDMNNDSIAYHYLGPKVWLRDGAIHPVADETLTCFPVLVESQYAALMSLGGQRAPGFSGLTAIACLLLVAGSLALRLGISQKGAWWMAALIITMPTIHQGAYGFIDTLFAAFVLVAARVAFDATSWQHHVLFGIFCGCAMGTKYTGLIAWVLLVLCAFLISVWCRKQTFPVLVRNLAVSCGIAIAFACPFYLRNWILFGCPIFPPPPILMRIFDVRGLLPTVLHELQKNVSETGVGLGRTLGKFLLLPYNLTYHTANFRGAGGIGLAPLALAPFGLLASRRNAAAMGLAAFALLQMTAWFWTAQVSRYVIHVYVIAAIFAVLGWQYVSRTCGLYSKVSVAWVIACSVCYGLVMIVPNHLNDIHAVASASFEQKRRHEEVPFFESFDYVNNDPAVTKLLVLDPHISAYYSDKTYIKAFGRWGEQTLPEARTPQDALAYVSDLHASHVMDVCREGGSFVIPLNTPGLTLVFETKTQRIYRVG